MSMFSWFVISKVVIFCVVLTGLGGGLGLGGGCFTDILVHGSIIYHHRHCFTMFHRVTLPI